MHSLDLCKMQPLVFYLLTAHTNASISAATSTVRLNTAVAPTATASTKELGESLHLKGNTRSPKCGKNKSV